MLFYLTGYAVMCFKHCSFLFLDNPERVIINVDEKRNLLHTVVLHNFKIKAVLY